MIVYQNVTHRTSEVWPLKRAESHYLWSENSKYRWVQFGNVFTATCFRKSVQCAHKIMRGNPFRLNAAIIKSSPGHEIKYAGDSHMISSDTRAGGIIIERNFQIGDFWRVWTFRTGQVREVIEYRHKQVGTLRWIPCMFSIQVFTGRRHDRRLVTVRDKLWQNGTRVTCLSCWAYFDDFYSIDY